MPEYKKQKLSTHIEGEKLPIDLIVKAEYLVTCGSGDKLKRGVDMLDIGVIQDGAVAVKNGKILDTGKYKDIITKYSTLVEKQSDVVLPGFVDSHTHPIFSGSRVDEYIKKSQGAPYIEILKSGGGILGTVKNTRKASEEELTLLALSRLDRMLTYGSTTIEAKSGYGLSKDEEIRHLRILKKLNKIHPIDITSTFLGAHTVPPEYKEDRKGYLKLICEEMIPQVAEEKLAEFVDVFCEDGAFSIAETEQIFETAHSHGLKTRIHAEQFNSLGGALLSAKMGSLSCDHLLKLSDEDMEYIATTDTVCTFLPACEFFLNSKEYAPMRRAIDKGVAVALATDFNAGTALSESMAMTMSIALLQMKIKPEEVITAGTLNPAISIGKGSICGSISKGKSADMILIDYNCGNYKHNFDYRNWLYHFGVNMIGNVIKNGITVYTASDIKREV